MSWLDGNYLDDIKDTVWFATLKMLNPEIDLKGIHQFEDVRDAKNIPWTFPPNKIRHTYQQGQPDFNRDENYVFIHILEENDLYGQFNDNIFELDETKTDVVCKTSRTIVLKLQYIVYGDLAFKIINRIKDCLFYEDIKNTLTRKGIFLVPDLNYSIHAPEHHDGMWWERWDWNTRLNYLHNAPDENLGAVESVEITINTNI